MLLVPDCFTDDDLVGGAGILPACCALDRGLRRVEIRAAFQFDGHRLHSQLWLSGRGVDGLSQVDCLPLCRPPPLWQRPATSGIRMNLTELVARL